MSFHDSSNDDFKPEEWFTSIEERVDSGEMSLRDALHAAALSPLAHQHDMTFEFQVALIALGQLDLAKCFKRVLVTHSSVGIGINVTGTGERPLNRDDMTPEERLAVNTVNVAIMTRLGVAASINENGEMEIHDPEDDDEEDEESIVAEFVNELDHLAFFNDPKPKGGWDKWTPEGGT